MDVAPRTIAVYGDLVCPWMSLAVVRLHRARARLGLEGVVALDIRAWPLELVNSRPASKRDIDLEVALLGPLVPDEGWRPWARAEWAYPVTMLLPLEAVEAAKEQGLRASEVLDLRLRRAFLQESRCIALRSEILAAAEDAGIDATALAEALDDGRARRRMIDQWRASDGVVRGSPHLFLPDGSDEANPGMQHHWEGEGRDGRPVIDRNDDSVYDDLLARAAR